MSDYMVKMGANPETLEECQDNLIGDLLMVMRWKEEGNVEKSREWVRDIVKPQMLRIELMKPAHWGCICMEGYDDDLGFTGKVNHKLKFQERKELYKKLLQQHEDTL